MVIGYHILLGMYGFWLPNDPRGSRSKFVWSDDLAMHGEATTVYENRSYAADAHDHRQRLKAKSALKFPEVQLTGTQAQQVALGIGEAVAKNDFELLAFSILPQHVHCVAVSDTFKSEEIVKEMKRYGSNRLSRSGLHPLYELRDQNKGRIPSVWAEGHWSVYIDSKQQLENAIRYVEQNPIKEGKPHQNWSFVKKT